MIEVRITITRSRLALLVLSLVALFAWSGWTRQDPHTATMFTLVDKDGKTRGVWATLSDGSPMFSLMDKSGKPRGTWSVLRDGTLMLNFLDENGTKRIQITQSKTSSLISIRDAAEKFRAGLAHDLRSSSLYLTSPNEQPQVIVQAVDDGDTVASLKSGNTSSEIRFLTSQDGSTLRMLDTTGKEGLDALAADALRSIRLFGREKNKSPLELSVDSDGTPVVELEDPEGKRAIRFVTRSNSGAALSLHDPMSQAKAILMFPLNDLPYLLFSDSAGKNLGTIP